MNLSFNGLSLAHQICLKYKRKLHRDVSRNNILLEPVHYDVDKFDDYEEAKFLGYILDPNKLVFNNYGTN